MIGGKLILLVLISFMLAACASNSYKGEYLDGQYHGQGVFSFASGSRYVGEFKRGMYNGQGTYTFADGRKYVGAWKDDKYHGQGTFTFADGRTYVGEWKSGKFNGQGTYSYPDGRKYVGEYKSDQRHGQGTFTAANGKITVGIWANGKLKQETLNPQSSMLVNGGSYDGAVANGKPSGKGVYTRQVSKWLAFKVYSDNWTGDGAANGVKIEVPTSGNKVYYFHAPVLRDYIASGTFKISMGTRNSSQDPYTEVPYEGTNTIRNASFSQDIRYAGQFNASSQKSFRIKETPGYTGVLDQWGRKQGQGKLVTADKRVYIGGFKDDLFHGDKTRQYYDGISWEDANYFNGFKVGYGRIYYENGYQYKAIYDKGRPVDGTISAKDVYTKKDNTSTFDHAEGKVQYLKNNRVVTEYDLSDPSKFTFCNVSNINWPKRIMVLGKSCTRAKVGFTPNLRNIFKNLKLVGSGTYLIQNADLEEVIKIGGATGGTFRRGVADLTIFDYKTGQVSYRGGFSSNKRHGKALCAYANGLEPCRYHVGKRIDETHQARVAQKKREAEQARLAQQAQNCQNSFTKLENEMNRMGNLGSASCQTHINDALDALDTVVREADCGGCGQRPFKNARYSASSCVEENRKQLNWAGSSARGAISGLSKNACLDQAAQSQMRRGVDNLQREVENQLSAIKSSSDHLGREYERIIWPKLDRIADNNNAVWMGAINAFQNAARDIMAQKQQNHNVQLGLMREQQQLQQSLKIQRSKVQASQNYASQQLTIPTGTTTKAFVDPRAAAKKSCVAGGHSWNGEYCNVKSTIKFPGRACYDPSGKSCKTGETVYYNKTTGNYDAAFQRSDASVQAKFNGGTTSGGSNTGVGSSGTGTGSGAQTQGSDSQTKTPEMGAVRVEATSYCWQNKKKTSWYCHGTTQRTLLGDKLESAKGASGCAQGTRKKALKDGLLFYCGFGMETYHDDIAAIYDAPGALLSARNNYQCKRFQLATCRDIMN